MAASAPSFTPPNSREVRSALVDALRLDLVGPWPGHEFETERLPGHVRPSTWYLTGFLIPSGTAAVNEAHTGDPDEDDDVDMVSPKASLDEESADERRSAKRSFFPSSMGISLLLPAGAESITVTAQWGEYVWVDAEGDGAAAQPADGEGPDDDRSRSTPESSIGGSTRRGVWQRRSVEHTATIPLGQGDQLRSVPIGGSNGVELNLLERPVVAPGADNDAVGIDAVLPPGTRSVAVFLVNNRPADRDQPDVRFLFQAQIEVESALPIVPRPDLRGMRSRDFDERIADLHYADTPEYATGHGVSAQWNDQPAASDAVRRVWTTWIPSVEVPKTETAQLEGVELAMDRLGAIDSPTAVVSALRPLVEQYRAWIDGQRQQTASLGGQRRQTADELLDRAAMAADRIEEGIRVLEHDGDARDAFALANRAVAQAIRQRRRIDAPRWRAFQLAFILLNLPGLANPKDPARDIVDLLFFPTGGGKTEAYLGLAAFTMVLRRLRHPQDGGRAGAGVTVIMRYTLRLLTLDQLGRAAGLVCALELERQKDPDRYGEWPFEIGLWVGKAATPNVMGRKGDGRSNTARLKVKQYKDNPKGRSSPIPIEECPWCGTRLDANSFALLDDHGKLNFDRPTQLVVRCVNPKCDFCRDRPLPIVAVDDPIYRRLPAFLIATVDKFATLPWKGDSGALLGGADRFGKAGFYGPAETGIGTRLSAPIPPPDLIIQDELHLISGPLGTMAGLYETAIEALCVREIDDRAVRPKIVASTATVRQAGQQVRALFARHVTALFPPAGVTRHDSFFADTTPLDRTAGRLYVGVAAPGRNPKVTMRRTWLPLMGASQRLYEDAGGSKRAPNPADPYMTVLGYFNSLRELGGARRIVEEEIQNTVKRYGARRRIGELPGLFRDRRQMKEVVELTSRVPTAAVAEARRRLDCDFTNDDHVDCAIATNMISVGLDIQRLGLMLVLGQPKSHAEYIQATSRVGRDESRPGLVVTLLNLNKPRDRSHYERFRHYHESFYRAVEVASVTPFAARALDRGLAGAVVTLARHAIPSLVPATGVAAIAAERVALERRLVETFEERIRDQSFASEEERDERMDAVRRRIGDLLDSWQWIVNDYANHGVSMQYQKHEVDGRKPLLREMLDTDFESHNHRKFRVNRSLRDVEPEVALYLKTLKGGDVPFAPTGELD